MAAPIDIYIYLHRLIGRPTKPSIPKSSLGVKWGKVKVKVGAINFRLLLSWYLDIGQLETKDFLPIPYCHSAQTEGSLSHLQLKSITPRALPSTQFFGIWPFWSLPFSPWVWWGLDNGFSRYPTWKYCWIGCKSQLTFTGIIAFSPRVIIRFYIWSYIVLYSSIWSSMVLYGSI